MLSPQFVNRDFVVKLQSLFLSLPTVPLLLSSILGTWFWRGPLKPLAADTSGKSSHLNLVWLQENKVFTPRSLQTVNEAPAGLTEAHVLLFADDVLLFVTHLFPFITSSLQGPPNYSTYAGLHSNQILTVKVCASQQTDYFAALPLWLSRSKTLAYSLRRCQNLFFSAVLSFFVDRLGYFLYSSPSSAINCPHFSSSLFSAFFLLLFRCVSDGLPPIRPRLSLWRAVQHLSETLFKGRPSVHARVHLHPVNKLFSLMLD